MDNPNVGLENPDVFLDNQEVFLDNLDVGVDNPDVGLDRFHYHDMLHISSFKHTRMEVCILSFCLITSRRSETLTHESLHTYDVLSFYRSQV